MQRNLDSWREALDRLTDKSGGPDACWLWTGKLNTGGYGKIYIDGADRIVTRMVLECNGIALAAGDEACHHCDNRKCLNLAHLYAGSPKMNVRDMKRRGRLVLPDGRSIRTIKSVEKRQARRDAWEEAHQIEPSELHAVRGHAECP